MIGKAALPSRAIVVLGRVWSEKAGSKKKNKVRENIRINDKMKMLTNLLKPLG